MKKTIKKVKSSLTATVLVTGLLATGTSVTMTSTAQAQSQARCLEILGGCLRRTGAGFASCVAGRVVLDQIARQAGGNIARSRAITRTVCLGTSAGAARLCQINFANCPRSKSDARSKSDDGLTRNRTPNARFTNAEKNRVIDLNSRLFFSGNRLTGAERRRVRNLAMRLANN